MIGKTMRRLRRLIRAGGYDVVRYDPRSNYLALRKFLLGKFEIDTVLDVGANVGGFGIQLRDLGYTQRIISFEPISDVFKVLSENATKDKNWTVNNFGLGNFDGMVPINIAANNAESSSILPMRALHVQAAKSAQYVACEDIQVKQLDTVFDSMCGNARNIYLKIDTQGFEKRVLEGAQKSLDRIATLQLELSFESLYENDTSFSEMYSYLHNLGFRAASFEPGFFDPERGQMLQIDGIFHRY